MTEGEDMFADVRFTYEEYKTVSIQHLDAYSREGWHVLQLVQETAPALESTTMPCPGGNNDRPCVHGHVGTCWSMIEVGHGTSVTTTYAILGRGLSDQEKVLLARVEELKAEIADKDLELTKAYEEGKKFAEDYLQRNTELNNLIRAHENLRTDHTRLEELYELEKTSSAVMEDDLGKLREHFGSLAFDRALDKIDKIDKA